MSITPNERFQGAFLFLAIGFVLAGIPAIINLVIAFRKIRQKRTVQDIPTSTIRSLAMGKVELNGRPLKTSLLCSPLSQSQCVYYKYSIEKMKRYFDKRGTHTEWVEIASGDSARCPFWITDGNATVMIYPYRAETTIKQSYFFESSIFRRLPECLCSFMYKYKIKYKSLLGLNKKMRFNEWCIVPGDNVYVMGTAQKTEDIKHYLIEGLKTRAAQLNLTAEESTDLDSNNDKDIGDNEFLQAAQKIEQDLLNAKLDDNAIDELTDIVVTWSNIDKIFLLSNRSEKELKKILGTGAAVNFIISFFLGFFWIITVIVAFLILTVPDITIHT